MTPADEFLLDELIAHGVRAQRLSASERRRIAKLLDETRRQLEALLAGGELTDWRQARVASMLAEAKTLIDDVYAVAASTSREVMVGLAQLDAAVTAEAVGRAAVAVLEHRALIPAEPVLRALVDGTLIHGAPSAEWWRRQAGDTEFRFKAAVRQGVVQGQTNAQIVRQVREAMDVSRRNAEALVRSSVMTVLNAARRESIAANADIMAGWRQVSTLDDRTTDICIAYDGQQWDLDGKPIRGSTLPFNGGPPRHWNCRSTLVPITKTWRELGVDLPEFKPTERASKDGPVPAGERFGDWLARKEASAPGYADRLLGKGRAALWRGGKISLRQLLDQNGRPLTLAELTASL